MGLPLHLNVYSFTNKAPEEMTAQCFTLKKAQLTMLIELERVVDYYVKKNPTEKRKHIVLTPLAAAAFSADTILSMASETGICVGELCKIINASCAGGGHILPYSNSTIAVAATVHATKNLADVKLRDQLISKVVRQYTTAHKPLNSEIFVTCLQAINGGLPQGWDFKSIMAKSNEVDLDLTITDTMKLSKLGNKIVTEYRARTKSSPSVIPSTSSKPAA